MPKSLLATKFTPPPVDSAQPVDEIEVVEDPPGSLDEYAPSEPGLDLDEVEPDLLESLFQERDLDSIKALELAPGNDDPEKAPVPSSPDPVEGEQDWIDDSQLEAEIRDATTGVELVTLRYFVGLKSKTGADVTAGIQQIVLKITQQFPLRVLHCDPGTEFASDSLARWLPSQGIRLQTTIPTDKQGNGLAERMVGWFKSRARTLLAANSLPTSFWPLAMRWASEAYNRDVLGMSPLPAFGQRVLHKLKKPAGAHKELIGGSKPHTLLPI